MYEETYDSVTYELAELSSRLVAIIIDGIILAVISGLLFGAGRGVGGALSFVIGLGYNWYFWTRNNGQTPGKMLMNIRVVKTDGTPIRDVDALMRYVGYYINSAILLLGWIWALSDEHRQGWHDKLANTYVVKAEKRKNTVV